ncbi:hypothetical protein CLV78_102356 [Aliiruegeria haliotis]|uniref:Lipoprotein n=1 Tax=Aliiruegeria haliotis TaxID=1280846 RepID=A0A2T0RVF2_9RHOB|nr:hypothetical protein [Aliiruegeria haliotis]PRY25179.1 hypothetical protein CLV78_102356 [Aliiruegeria haliotis]
MKTRHLAISTLALSLLGACAELDTLSEGGMVDARTVELPENVVALAAPGQDLSTARQQPEDGCYWYQWNGPVETTWIPLRSRDGRPICARPASALDLAG